MIESELKIPVDGLDAVRTRLQEAGAERLAGAELEVNVLFDTADGELQASSRVLRVRRSGGRHLLTYKGPARWSGAVKQRREIELEISDGGAISELLHALGFAPWIRYEKTRESWYSDDVRFDLDHTPMGDFVEIEGPPEALETAARGMGLDPSRAVAGSYISLWIEHRTRHPELGRDMVFTP